MGDGPLPDDSEEGITIPPILCPLNEAQHSLLCGEGRIMAIQNHLAQESISLHGHRSTQYYKLLTAIYTCTMRICTCILYVVCAHA